MAIFRPVRLVAPLVAVALLGLSACADPASRPSSGPAPTVTVVPGPSTPRAGTDDQSLRIDGGAGSGASCQAQCERSHNSCMDSVAARNHGGIDRTDSTPFSPTDNCSFQLKQCYQRCTSVR